MVLLTIYPAHQFKPLTRQIERSEILKKEYFWSDEVLQKKLARIPKGERSCIIRIALRDYFKLTDSKNGKVSYEKEDEHGELRANE